MIKAAALYVAVASLTCLQLAAKPTKTECRLPGYQASAPTLAYLNFEEAEKREIVQLVQEGRKMDAILIMRKCRDMSLKEQKAIVDTIQKGF